MKCCLIQSGEKILTAAIAHSHMGGTALVPAAGKCCREEAKAGDSLTALPPFLPLRRVCVSFYGLLQCSRVSARRCRDSSPPARPWLLVDAPYSCFQLDSRQTQ